MKQIIVEERNLPPVSLKKMVEELDLHKGDIVKFPIKTDKGKNKGYTTAVVKEVYKNHVLLDMGEWCESRTFAELYYGC